MPPLGYGPPSASPKPEGCHSETGEVCFYSTSVSATTTNGIITTTSQVTSACGTVIGCNAQGTTTSTTTTAISDPTAIVHVVYPKDASNQAQTDSIAQELKTLVEDPANVVTSTTETFGLNFWLVTSSTETADKIRNIPNVRNLHAF